MSNLIGIVGGDLRLAHLAEMFTNENYVVFTYLLEKYNFNNKNIIKCGNINEFKDINTIITSIPISKDKININTPFSNDIISIENLLWNIKNKTLFSGAINEKIKSIAKKNNVEIIDLLQNEELSILNAIPTAEGAIQIAMEKSNITLHGSNVLVMGFGRIGKILCKMLNALGVNIYCEARKSYDLAMINSYGYSSINLNELDKELGKFDFIFNTIPYLILDKQKLKKVKKECLIIDLASSPGGVDFEYAKEIGINAFLELALPGRVAPKTAAKYIKDVIRKEVNQ